MKSIVFFVILLLGGRATASEQIISVQHDSTRAVTCFITAQGGISCLPDSLLQSGTTERESGRASQASSVTEKGLSVATPLPQDERFKL